MLSPEVVDRILRVTIILSVVAWLAMLELLLFGGGHWAIWLPGLLACSGVIVSFAVHLNYLGTARAVTVGGGLSV